MDIRGENLNAKIVKVLQERGKASYASPWKVEKRAWMKLRSNCIGNPYELYAGVDSWTRDGMHDTSGRIVPKAGLTGINVSTTGTAGTMRKVQVKFKCYSTEQLKELRKAYFIPGMSVVASWGWNIQTDGSAITQLDSSKFSAGMGHAQKSINDWIERNTYSVDACMGLISDFNWSFNSGDGSFDCSITLQTPSSAYLTTSIDISSNKLCGCASSEDDEEAADGNGSWVKQAIKNQAEEMITKNQKWKDGNHYLGTAIQLDEDAKEETNFWARLGNWFSGTDNYYVTWEWFEAFITSGLSPESIDMNDNIPAGTLLQKHHSNVFGKKVWRLDSSGTWLNVPKTFFSGDPWVCLIPEHYHWDICGGKTYAGFAQIGQTAGLPNWGYKGAVPLVHMLINTHFLWKTYLESDRLDEYIMKLLKGVSDACGGIWDFAIVSDPDNPHVIRIQNKKEKANTDNITSLKFFGENSPARSWGMTTDLPADLKHSIMMGANKADEGAGQVGDGTEKSYRLYGGEFRDGVYSNLKLSTECVGKEKGSGCGKPKESKKATKSECKKTLKNAGKELARHRDDESVDEAKGALRGLRQFREEEADGGEQVIPIGFEGTFDGIGGLKWGQQFKVEEVNDLLTYKCFQITAVSHDVTLSDWTTSIETGLRMK